MLRHPRLASLATAEWPAWLWSADGSRILWANAVGAAIFGAKTSNACANRHFSVTELPAAQVLRLAATLPSGGQERLERLRGFGGSVGRALTCACSRIVAGDGSGAVLIVAVEPAGPALTLAERVERLLDADAEPMAAFLPDGRFVYANAKAQHWLDGAGTLAALGLEALAAAALQTGTAKAAATLDGDACDILLACLGQGSSSVLVFAVQPPARPTNQPLATEPETAPRIQAVPISSAPASAIAAPRAAAAASAATERRHPLRFVWDMDADGRFTIASNEFVQLIGPGAALLGRPWREVAGELDLDPHNQVADAVASRETWSGITVSWPISPPPGSDRHSELRLPVELSGLPVFDRDRSFRGYRGFGVCRYLAQINGLARPPRGGVAQVAVPPDQAPPRGGPVSANVVQFRPAAAVEPKPAPSLTPIERRAFRELAQELTSRLRGAHAAATVEAVAQELAASQDQALSQALSKDVLRQVLSQALYQESDAEFGEEPTQETSQESSQESNQESNQEPAQNADENPAEQPDTEASEEGHTESQKQSQEQIEEQSQDRVEASRLANEAIAQPLAGQLLEPAFLDRIPLGILVYRHDGLVYANRQFLDLSGYSDLAAIEAAGGLNRLFAEPDASAAFADGAGTQALAIITRSGERLPVEGRMVTVPWNAAPAMALILTKNQSEAAASEPAANVDNQEPADAQREAQHIAAAKAEFVAEFVAKISHDIRNPLTAIAGFAEAIMSERFGPIGNERYREYIKDLHAAAAHLSSMVDDMFDLSKLESGRIDLTFAKVNLNELVQQCVGMMQPQANRARIIIRSALTSALPPVKADERALRQIVLNLLSNSIKFTGPGGQIIVSTVFSDTREAILRVRDTGAGMSEKQIAAALEPSADIDAWASSGSGGTEFGLPLTKALAEANHAQFRIKSAPEAGTLVEIAFPPNRTVAD
ncbi:MAG: histidine kinase dimerization/phospho-acceptor domain-containing protein [Xanthobacteraceae bacterium]